MSEIKQVIVMRTDLNMRKGKMIAQGAHASMLFLIHSIQEYGQQEEGLHYGTITLQEDEVSWLENAFTKVCLRVDSEEELLEIANKARGLPVHVVRDSGKTEFHGEKTYTCLAIGPADADEIDKITGHLRLL